MSRARREAARRGDRRANIMLGVLGLTVFAIGAFVVQARVGAVALDDLRCREDGAYDALVVLVDRSDPLNAVQKIDIRQRLTRLIEASATGTRVSLQVLDADAPELVSTLFEGCKPDDGREVNQFVENERMIRERWRREFQEPLETTLSSSLADDSSTTSPIMEAVQLVALTALEERPRGGFSNRLVIVSDMIQNTAGYNQYRDSLDPQRFIGSAYSHQVAANLRGADVEIVYVGRPGAEAVQTAAHAVFWDAWLRDNGGRILSVDRVAGG